MKRVLLGRAVPFLGFVLLLAMPETTTAGSMRSAGSRSNRISSPPAISNVPPATRTAVAADEDYAYGAVDETADSVANIRLRVPANAQVWFNGKSTSLTGGLRRFFTEALEPGKDYPYEIRVRWTENGRPIEQTRKITVQSGDWLTLNVTQSR
jgi:uncharacterized protein (TIGR03000 family)